MSLRCDLAHDSGASTVLGQSPVDSEISKSGSTPSVPKPAVAPLPKPATAPLPKPASTPPAATPDSSVEDRLRRMEEAYRRIEEANKKIQGQYDGLLKKYDELKSQLKPGRGVEARPDRVLDDPSGESRRCRRVPGTARSRGQRGHGRRGNGRADCAGAAGGLRCGAEGIEGRGVFTSRWRIAFHGRGSGHDLARRGTWRGQPAFSGGHRSTGDGGTRLPAGVRIRAARRRCRGVSPRSSSPRDWNSHPPDDEFKLTFHNLTQAEYRGFPTSEQGILQSQFFIPRQRWYFTGRVTRNVEFYTVINRGYGSLDLLDAFISYRIDERFRFRAGRMKTPYLYEYYSIAEGDLIAPERSIYAGNMAATARWA